MKTTGMFRMMILLSALTAVNSYADVIINVSADMVEPICDTRSNDSSAPLKINFGPQNIAALNKATAVQQFPLYLSNCNFNKNLAIMITPNTGKSLVYNGKKVLETSIANLGISFNDMTGGTAKSLSVGEALRLTPVKVSDTEYRIDLQADLVTPVEPEKLALGKFTASAVVQVVYD